MCGDVRGRSLGSPGGLPDSPTPGTGLYDTLEISGLPYPEAVFELDFFRTNPQPFYRVGQSLVADWTTKAQQRRTSS